MLGPVMNLTVMYNPMNNTVEVMWEDMDNMVEDITYQVSYNITVAEVLLRSNQTRVVPDVDLLDNILFNYVISEGEFLQAGVRVSVEVAPYNMTERGPSEFAMVDVNGGRNKCIMHVNKESQFSFGIVILL